MSTELPNRKFIGRSFGPEFETLSKIRTVIDGVDEEIVKLLVVRSIAVLAATCHKESLEDVSQIDRQNAVIVHAFDLATAQDSPLEDFPELVRAIYQTAVPGFVALQEEQFLKTVSLQ
jgi:chorismate mutase